MTVYEKYTTAYMGTPESKRYFRIMDAVNVDDPSSLDPPLRADEQEVWDKLSEELARKRRELNRPDLIFVRPNDMDA